MISKFTRKYMLMAKVLSEENPPCGSRKVGCILVNADNRIISTGYNGSPAGLPHNDSKEYLEFLYNNLCTEQDKSKLYSLYQITNNEDFVKRFVNTGKCPRHILQILSGEKRWMCNCGCCERNCLANANRIGVSTLNSTMYLWFEGVCCYDCTIQIIQAGVKMVIALTSNQPDYCKATRGLFKMAKVEFIQYDKKEFS